MDKQDTEFTEHATKHRQRLEGLKERGAVAAQLAEKMRGKCLVVANDTCRRSYNRSQTWKH